MPIELRPHQLTAIEKLDNGKILYGGVGTGKTMTSLGYYATKEAPRDVYVITTAKKRDSADWQEEALHFGISTHREWCQDGVGPITVDSWQNINKYKDVKDAFFIFDEQKLVGSGAWTKAFIKIAKHNRWILLTATPGDTWMDYVAVFVANGFYKNKTAFVDEHVIYKPYMRYPVVSKYIGTGKLLKYRRELLVPMPYERHTKRITEDVICDFDKEVFDKVVDKRWNVYENRPLRDVSELFSVMRKVVNSSESRIQAVLSLMEKHPRIIVFYNFDYELEILRGLGSKTTLTEWNGHKHEPIPTTESWVYLVQYQAGAESWNCIETNAMIFYSLTYSYKNWYQGYGRIDRLNTPFKDLYYYVLMSNSLIDKAIRRSLRAKKDFNEREFGKI